MKIVLRHRRNWPILANISTTAEPVFTSISALVDICMQIIQVALLSQRDCATCLSVEILQLQNIAIVWHYLRDPRLAVFTQYRSVTDTPTQTDGQIHDDGMYCA